MLKRDLFPKSIRIVEVGPRDGLQNEKLPVPTAFKEKFIRLLKEAGHQTIEVTSFVRPDLMPQMSDARDVYNQVKDLENTTSLPCLVPNMKGLENAIELGVQEIAVFTAASESFNQRNINATISQSFDRIEPVVKEALAHKIKVRGYVSTAFGCPYEGYIDPAVVLKVSQKLRELGCYEISLGDTIGSATPFSVEDVLTRFECVSDLALHFHDTRAMALTNILIGLSFGINVFDSSSGGLGGCPYAKGATGNVATEDLVYLAQSLGIETGIDLQKQSEASEFILSTLNVQTKSKFLQAYLNGGKDIYMAQPKA